MYMVREKPTQKSRLQDTPGKSLCFKEGLLDSQENTPSPLRRRNRTRAAPELPRSGPSVAHPQANKRCPNLTAWLPPRQPFSQKTLKDELPTPEDGANALRCAREANTDASGKETGQSVPSAGHGKVENVPRARPGHTPHGTNCECSQDLKVTREPQAGAGVRFCTPCARGAFPVTAKPRREKQTKGS